MAKSYPQTVQGRLVAAYFDELERRGTDYALLRNYRGLPDHPRGDIDVVAADVRAAGEALHDVAATSGYVPVRVARHTWHRIHTLAPGAEVGAAPPVLVDIQPGVTHRRGISIPPDRVLAGRRRFGSMWVAGPAIEAAALIFHCALDRGSVPAAYADRLAELLPEHREEVIHELVAVVGGTARLAVDDLEAAIPAIRSAFGGQPLAALAQRAGAVTRFATARPPVLHAAPGVASQLEARGVRLASGRLEARRRYAMLVVEDGDATLADGIEASHRAYARRG
jgi:hypothetical protein